VVCAEPDQLVVVVRDWGTGMRPRPDSPGLGIGLPTIASLANVFDVEAADGVGTLLRMHFTCAAARAA
jgi:anti-sigma regulatory factor (Ser/Thr protein kinase)